MQDVFTALAEKFDEKMAMPLVAKGVKGDKGGGFKVPLKGGPQDQKKKGCCGGK
jgi:hypothetical protein